MGRALLVIETDADRSKAVHWIGKAPAGTRVEFKASKRSLPQNDLMWALLTEVSEQFSHAGKKYDPSQWKSIFLHAFGREISFLPSLDGKTFLPIEMSSSDLSKDEMTDFIEFILKEGAERGVVFKEQPHSGDDPSPSPSSLDSSDPASEPVTADPSATGSAVTQPLEWLLGVTKMLVAATNYKGDINVLKAQKRAAIASYEKPADCPEAITAKAEKVYFLCEKVVAGTTTKADGLALIAYEVGCDQDDLLPKQGRVA